MEDFEIVNQLHDIGISDEKIARQCNVSRQFICNVRNGKKKAGTELYTRLQELYDAANQRGLLDTYTPPAQTRIVESTPVMAPIPYDPSAQYIPSTQQTTPTRISAQTLPVTPAQPQPAKRKYPLSYAELVARNQRQKQGCIAIPQPAQPKKPYNPQLLPLSTRKQLNTDWKRARKHAKRNGLPIPPRPNMFEEIPIAETPEHQAPSPNTIDYPAQQNDYQTLIEYQVHSPYRQW